MKPYGWLATIFILAFTLHAGGAGNDSRRADPATLLRVQQVRVLDAAHAAESIPVHLQGVVSVPSVYKNSFFFIDASGGISVDQVEGAPPVKAGQRVQIDGTTGAGLFAPVVMASAVKTLGQQALPAPRLERAEDLAEGRQDSQWIAIRAQIRSALVQTWWGNKTLALKADVGSGVIVSVLVRDFSQGSWEKLIGSQVQIRGACASNFNDRRQFFGLRLFVNSLADIKLLQPAPADPFDIPSRPLNSPLQFNASAKRTVDALSPIKAQGTVTFAKAGKVMFLQDGQSALQVRTNQPGAVPVGSEVEVVGYPVLGAYGPVLEDAIYRVVASGRPTDAIATSASSMIVVNQRNFWVAPYDGLLVQIDGQIVEQLHSDSGDQLILRDGDVIFRAELETGTIHPRHLIAGTRVRITGVCEARLDDARIPQVFHLLLRTPADVVIVKTVPLWHRPIAGWAVSLTLLVLLIGLSLRVLLKNQSELRALAMKDPLTGVLNRRGFSLLAQRLWREAQRARYTLLLFYIDIDRFKQINDTFGHQSGDLTLMAVADSMRECFRPTDVLGRLGGDEFVVLCTTPKEVAGKVEYRLKRKLADNIQLRKLGFAAGISVGVLVCDASLGAATIEELIKQADSLMYGQKRDGASRETAAGR